MILYVFGKESVIPMDNITYKDFIDNIIKTRGRHGCGDEYHESHHIIPRCIGGNNSKDNLVDLFAKEHYEAHRLLAIENPNEYGLIFAWHMMSIMNDDNGRCYQLTTSEYEESRVAYANMISRLNTGKSNPFYGKKHTVESKQKMSQSSIGKHHSKESREKMSKSRMGDQNAFYGKHHSLDSIKKISDSRIGAKNPRSKFVYCIELNKTFGSTREAERETGVCYRSIVNCANGKQKYAGKHPITGEKLTWIYVYNENKKNDIS